MHQDQFFRANVGAIIINGKNQVLAFKRSKIKGEKKGWQFPQGGIDPEEAFEKTAKRELWEETAIRPEEDLLFLEEYPKWTVYELPTEMRSNKSGRGQAQRWFLFQVKDENLKIDVSKAKDKEFSASQWMKMEDLIEIVIAFRKPVYQELFEWLKERKKD